MTDCETCGERLLAHAPIYYTDGDIELICPTATGPFIDGHR